MYKKVKCFFSLKLIRFFKFKYKNIFKWNLYSHKVKNRLDSIKEKKAQLKYFFKKNSTELFENVNLEDLNSKKLQFSIFSKKHQEDLKNKSKIVSYFTKKRKKIGKKLTKTDQEYLYYHFEKFYKK